MKKQALTTLFFCLPIYLLLTITVQAATVFGPENFQTGRWKTHFSFHTFTADPSVDGQLTVSKTTLGKRYKKGFLVVNGNFINLRHFLRGNNVVLERNIPLRQNNYMFVFFRGQRRAALSIEINQGSSIPPEITFAANPTSLISGENSTLTWSTENAETVEIQPSIGSVQLNGSLVISPIENTLYTLTATGAGGSASASTTITVTIPEPTVSINAEPATVELGNSSTLSWSSTNANSCTMAPGIGSVDCNSTVSVSPVETTSYTITATGIGGTTTASATVSVTIPEPTASITAAPTTIELGNSSTLSWTSTDADSCSIEPGIGSVDCNSTVSVSPVETTSYTITAIGAGGTATAITTLIVESNEPMVSISADPETIAIGELTLLTWNSSLIETLYIDNGIGTVTLSGSLSVSPTSTTTYTISGTGPVDTVSSEITVYVTGSPELQSEGTFGEQYNDLIPEDATVESYDEKRFSLITGLVNDEADLSLAGVTITIFNHPGYGTVTTNNEGRFSLPVEGGEILTIVYKKEGRITSHRQVNVGWNDYGVAETIKLLPVDTAVTDVVFDGNSETITTHTSTEVSDSFGSRSASIVFSGDNQAFLTDKEGNDVLELSKVSVRATENNTPESMPATLPSNSAFTYCAEYKIDGAERVRFAQPVPLWVDNFLGFDVGLAVPIGYYDRDKAQWIPSDNGVVVRLLDTDSDGIVDSLDATGDDLPDDLNLNGSFTDEVVGLADTNRFEPGKTFWRAEISHFTPIDWNWPYGLPSDAVASDAPSGYTGIPATPDQCSITNSYVKHKAQIFHEDIAIPGTDLALHYASDRVQGYKHRIIVPASSDQTPISLKSIIVKLEIAGNTYTEVIPAAPNQIVEFIWDGKDHLGNSLKGNVTGYTSVGFVYDGVYLSGRGSSQDFGQAGTDVTPIQSRQEIIYWKNSTIIVEQTLQQQDYKFAQGWTLSNHHYLALEKLLIRGNGTSESAVTQALWEIDTLRAVESDMPDMEMILSDPRDVAVDKEGNIYISDWGYAQIRKVDTDGTVTTIHQSINAYIAVGPEGALYISDMWNNRILRRDNTGDVTTIAGTGVNGFSGDNGPAVDAMLYRPTGIATDWEGNVYFADSFNYRIRRISSNGIISTIAGTGVNGFSGDDGLAIDATMGDSDGIALDQQGNLYIPDSANCRIRKIDTTGIITTVAGNGVDCMNLDVFGGDNGPAVEAQLSEPYDVDIDREGNIYIATIYNSRIRKVDTAGIITTIAGTGVSDYTGDNGPAIEANLYYPMGVAAAPDGNIYIADSQNNRIRKLYPSPMAQRTSLNGSELYVHDKSGIAHIFNPAGYLQKTIDSHTGTILSDFTYDSNNRLTAVTDRFGNITTIERDVAGTPTAILSPYGHRTDLTVDNNNNLTDISFEDFTGYSFGYSNDGLMTSMVNPRNLTSTHDFDSTGRVINTEDPENGIWTLAHILYTDGSVNSSISSSEGNTTSHLETREPGDVYRSISTYPNGSKRSFISENQGLDETVAECGMSTTTHNTLDKKSKRQVPESIIATTPAGLTNQLSINKSYSEDSNGQTLTSRTSLDQNGDITVAATNFQTGAATITSPEGRVSSRSFDLSNLLISDTEITGLLPNHFDYDTHGRLTTVTTGTRSTSYNYDIRGNINSVIDPLSRTTSYSYDLLDRVTQIDRADNASIQFQYDAAGNMTILTTPTPADNVFAYNGVNKVSGYTSPLSSVTTYAYDKERKLTSVVLPSGKIINNTYTNGLLSQIVTPEWITSYQYTCRDLPSLVERGTEQINYGYDGKLLTSMSQSGSLTQNIAYTYDNSFNISTFDYAGTAENISYDGDQLPITIGRFAIIRNSGNGLPESITDTVFNVDRNFNGYGELSTAAYSTNGTNSFIWDVSRDASGRIVSKTETLEGTSIQYVYTYDFVGRLLTVSHDGTLVEEYQYDNNGNRVYEMNSLLGISGKTSSYSIEDHLLLSGSTSFVYDYDDNLADIVNGTETTSFTYSSTGELQNATLPDGTTITYIHDPLGRRIVKLVNSVIIEKYLWSGLTTLLAVYDADDNIMQRFEYADSRVPYAMTSGGTAYYLSYDQVGSLRTITDTFGALIKRIDYDSFGNIINDSNPSFAIPFGFAGGLYDRDTGLVRFGFRDYSPAIGRWTAKDPILFAGGDSNLYGYVRNDPVNFIDPLGLRVSVVYRPLKDGAYGLGYHQAISVNGEIYGFSKNVGVINENPGDYGWGSHEKVIYPGNEHDQAFLDYLKSAEAGNDPRFTKDTYGLCTNNCMSFVDAALQEAIQQENSSCPK